MAQYRIQFDLTEDKVKRLDHLMDIGGLTTRKELFNNAMALLEWVIKQKMDGYSICAVNEKDNSSKELAMPILDHIERVVRN